jgi:hypothetical protein
MRSLLPNFRPKRLALPLQRAAIDATWPSLITRVSGSILQAEGEIQPSPVTRTYRVRLIYEQGRRPRVQILSPRLERRPSSPEEPIPHTYNESKPGEERPCCFDPNVPDWDPGMLLARSVIPWMLAWLVDYEIWTATGLWLGGGRTHTPEEQKADLDAQA